MDLIDGNQIASAIIAELKAEVGNLKGRKPCIALVRVGNDPASLSYVAKKEKTAAEIGITSRVILPPETISQDDLFALHLRLERAADATVGARRQHGVPRLAELDERVLTERRRRTRLHAGATRHTG